MIYTQAQVTSTLQRALNVLLLISQKIENGFYYLYSAKYNEYKHQQYDVYILFKVINKEQSYVGFGDYPPSTYEANFYALVGKLIWLCSNYDLFQSGQTISPGYQPPSGGGGFVIENVFVNSMRIPFSTDGNTPVTLSNFQSVYASVFGDYAEVTIWITQDNYATSQQDTGTTPIITNLGSDINRPDTYTWVYPNPTVGYIQISGYSNNGQSTPVPTNLPLTNSSSVLLSDADLNAFALGSLYGQLVLLPNVPCKYFKLDNSPTGQWDLQTYTPNS